MRTAIISEHGSETTLTYLPPELAGLASYRGPVAFDTETSGLRWWRDTVGLVSFATGPLDENAYATRDVPASVAALQARIDAGLVSVAHNFGFDLHFLEKAGLRIRWDGLHDTLIKARLLNNLGEHDLDSLAVAYLGIPKHKDELRAWLVAANKLFKKKATWHSENGREATYLDVPEEILMPYARQDATVTWRLWDLFSKMQTPNYDRERHVRALMFVAERDGVEVLPDVVVEKRERAVREERAAEQQLYRLHGSEMNLDSNDQLAKWLYDDLGLHAVSFTPKGAPQVNEFNLTSNPHPVTRLLNTRNKRHKTGEFLDSYLTLMDDRRILHPTINTLQARTTRFSLSSPNLQQIPTRGDRFKVREVFTAGSGWFIGADYDKQELRIAAEEARDFKLLRDLSAGTDVYIAMAEAMLGFRPGTSGFNKNSPERQAAKIAVLSMIYGAGAPKVAESFTVNTGRPYTVEQAKGIRDNFYYAYPNLKVLMQQQMRAAQYAGKVVNRWGYDLYVERDRTYVATDYLVQSSGRQVMVDAIFRTSELLKKYGGHLLWPIHDEILAWLPEEPSPEQVKEFGDAVVSYKFSQPMTATPMYGKTMASLH